jgi:hypothetical protein
VNVDKCRVGQRRGEELGMIKAHGAIIPSSQDQRWLCGVTADISRSPKVDQKPRPD